MRRLINLALTICLVLPSISSAKTVTACDLNLARPEQSTEELEKLAVEIMRQVGDHKSAGTDTVLGWMKSIKDSGKDHPPSVMEHVALVFILKSGVFDNHEDPQVVAELRETVRNSYLQLAKKPIVEGEEFTPLPASLLHEGSLAALIFHDAIVKPNLQIQMRQQLGPLNLVNTLTALLTGVALAFEPGRYLVAGGLVGLTQASINEFMIHIGVGHAPKPVAKAFRRLGGVGEFLEQITLAHKLHHTVVSAYFGAANLPPEQKAMAEKTLRKLVEGLILDRMKEKFPNVGDKDIKAMPEYIRKVERLIKATREGNYGVNGTWKGALGMLATATPFYVMNYALYVLTGSETFLVSSEITLTTMILQSLYSHWYLHLAPEDEKMPGVNRFQLYYVKYTWLGQLARRLHFTHHDLPYSSDRTKNGVIMAGSVYDRLKGDFQMSSLDDLIKMFQEGILTGD